MPGQEAANTASAFIIQELSGDQRTLRLVERALPYRPFSLTGSQRVETVWYPGSPIATQQVFGAREESTTIRGMWKDRFIKPRTQGIALSTPSATLSGQPIEDVLALAKIVDDMRRKGQQVQVSWDEIARVGTIKQFKQSWQRRQDLEWEIEFEWASQGDAPTPSLVQRDTTSGDISSQTSTQVQRTSSDATTDLPLAPNYFALVNNRVGALLGSSTLLTTLATSQTTSAVGPDDAIRHATGTLGAIAVQAQSLMDATQSAPPATLFFGSAPASVPLGRVLAVVAYNRTLRNDGRDMRDDATTRREQLARQVGADLLATYRARSGQDLRDVSLRFYRTPNEWRRLLTFNGLATSELTAGQLVLVPRLQRRAA
jgi:hypothetical protein